MQDTKNLMLSDVWERVLRKIEPGVNRKSFDMWLKPTILITFSNGEAGVLVPNHFFGEWVLNNYGPLICENLKNELGVEEIKLDFVSKDRRKGAPQEETKEEKNNGNSAVKRINPNLRYTFETFVIGSSNQFAHAASYKVAEKPGMAYNPLFLYGGVGLGKTHLLSAIGNFILSKEPTRRVLYLSAEQFTNETIASIRNNKMPELKDKYRTLDVLLMDDIQFLAKKERTQEEFFHTFNTLYESNKQIVVSSDRSAEDISDIDERLRSRFGMGLVADIQSPDLETRIVILKQKAELEGIIISNDVGLYLATHVKKNVRELEGALIRVGAFSELTHQEITVDLAKRVLRDTITEKKMTITVEDIQKIVSERFHVKIADLKSRKRTKNIVCARQVSMYLTRELIGLSFPEIGRHFGGKDHSTIIHACKQIENRLESDFNFKITIESLTQHLKEG